MRHIGSAAEVMLPPQHLPHAAVVPFKRRASRPGKGLLSLALKAHGGLSRWDSFSEVHAQVSIRGEVWVMKQNPGILGTFAVQTPTRAAKVAMTPFVSAGWQATFEPDLVTIRNNAGTVVERLGSPATSFDGHDPETAWTDLHVAYFSGCTLWTHLTAPFLFATAGAITEELEPWIDPESAEEWRRLWVALPEGVASHSREQVAYFGPDGMLRRRDETLDELGGMTTATYVSAYRSFDGIEIPTVGRTYSTDPDGIRTTDPVLISVDVSDAALA